VSERMQRAWKANFEGFGGGFVFMVRKGVICGAGWFVWEAFMYGKVLFCHGEGLCLHGLGQIKGFIVGGQW